MLKMPESEFMSDAHETAGPLESLEQVIEGEFIGTATVGDKGQIVLPIEARRALEFKPGDKLMVYLRRDRGQVRLMKADLVTALMNRALGEIRDLQRVVKSVKYEPVSHTTKPRQSRRAKQR